MAKSIVSVNYMMKYPNIDFFGSNCRYYVAWFVLGGFCNSFVRQRNLVQLLCVIF